MTELYEQILEVSQYLDDPRDEPFPNGTESDRLHYWRTKAIRAAASLRNIIGEEALIIPETQPVIVAKLERRVEALTNMMDRMLTMMESQQKVDALRRGRSLPSEKANRQLTWPLT